MAGEKGESIKEKRLDHAHRDRPDSKKKKFVTTKKKKGKMILKSAPVGCAGRNGHVGVKGRSSSVQQLPQFGFWSPSRWRIVHGLKIAYLLGGT